jgi:hypothetical protein
MAIPAALPPLPFNPTRVRSYVLRLPLFTRLVLLIILAFWLLELQTIWSVVQWGSLTPNEIGIGSSMSSRPCGLICSRLLRLCVRTVLTGENSVPTKHLSIYSRRLFSRFRESASPHTVAGAIRS